MLIFFYGEDTYRIKEGVKLMIERYKNKGFVLKFFNCQENSSDLTNYFKDEINQYSIFKKKELVVISNVFSSPGDIRKKLLEEKEKLTDSKNVFLFFEEEKDINKKDKFFSFLRKKAECQEFRLFSFKEVKNWAGRKFNKRNFKVEEAALELLVQYAGINLWRVKNEVEKLMNYRIKEKFIEKKDVEILVKPENLELNIFTIVDVISQKKKNKALKLLRFYLEKGDSPLYLLTMISYQFRNLLIVKDLISKGYSYDFALKKSGLHPFVFKKTYSQSFKFSFEELKKIYRKILEIDFTIKNGKIEPFFALEMFIIQI